MSIKIQLFVALLVLTASGLIVWNNMNQINEDRTISQIEQL